MCVCVCVFSLARMWFRHLGLQTLNVKVIFRVERQPGRGSVFGEEECLLHIRRAGWGPVRDWIPMP